MRTLIKRKANQFDTISAMRKYALLGSENPFFTQFIQKNNVPPTLSGVQTVAKYIFDNVNPILYNVKNFMELSGYTFKVFESIYNYNVEINDMLYQINNEITKKFDISKFIGCLNDVFNIENNDL